MRPRVKQAERLSLPTEAYDRKSIRLMNGEYYER